jgi:glc operon protein GlcG
MKMMRGLLVASLAGVSVLLGPAVSAAQIVEKPGIGLEAAKAMSAAAVAEAQGGGWRIVFAVVDEGGHLVYLERMDGLPPGVVDLTLAKARSSASFGAPTAVFKEMIEAGELWVLSSDGVVPVAGGLPIRMGGRTIGAIGVGGATAGGDSIVAHAALEALSLDLQRDR